jgi:hypothetical protein
MEERPGRGLLIAGGVCGVLWPLLTLGYYVAYPLAAGGVVRAQAGGAGGFALRVAELGGRPAVVALEWVSAGLPLLLWPFLLALCRVVGRRGARDLALVGLGLGLLGSGLMVASSAFNPTALHALGRAYAEAGSDAARTTILAVLDGLLSWMRGLNQTASLLYQACVALFGLALIRSRTWRGWGWVGVVGAILAVPAKVPLGLRVPTNFLWTGLAYGLWPLAMGIALVWRRVDWG